ncbi:MAG: two component transcriptional regulator, winged helix family [Herbinix sp.]|jgi:DNA-binding response OmpR family regulator|nr:two component transcriptional regulator, winged helix family [Herbinix sp.]
MRILIVEDETTLAEALAEIIRQQKWSADAVYNGRDGLDYGLSNIYDVIVLDIMLPVMNGLEVLKELRTQGISVPIIILTAKSEIQNKITGLDTGADDYLTKPFSAEELMARIRALTRRKGEYIGETLSFGDLTLYKNTYELFCQKQSIKLGIKEYQIMELLFHNPRQILPKELFIEKIWGYDSEAEYNSIEVYMSFLRKKLNLLETTVKITTTRGVGYLLEESV